MTSDTHLQLLALHRAPAVHLEAICEHYLSLSPAVARQRAALNALPFPTFRMNDSAKAPLMVKIADLAKHIDQQHQLATAGWEASQL